MERHYKNLGYFSLILVAFVAVGFDKPYFALIPNFDPFALLARPVAPT
jgi:hypothetical protein